MQTAKVIYLPVSEEYHDIEELKQILIQNNRKFILDCGHKVTLGHNFGANIVIINSGGDNLEIICTECYD